MDRIKVLRAIGTLLDSIGNEYGVSLPEPYDDSVTEALLCFRFGIDELLDELGSGIGPLETAYRRIKLRAVSMGIDPPLARPHSDMDHIDGIDMMLDAMRHKICEDVRVTKVHPHSAHDVHMKLNNGRMYRVELWDIETDAGWMLYPRIVPSPDDKEDVAAIMDHLGK